MRKGIFKYIPKKDIGVSGCGGGGGGGLCDNKDSMTYGSTFGSLSF